MGAAKYMRACEHSHMLQIDSCAGACMRHVRRLLKGLFIALKQRAVFNIYVACMYIYYMCASVRERAHLCVYILAAPPQRSYHST